ncbi:hypothetical protein MVES1_003344 [Malassezia vespertilionis]|uniref:Rim101p n=1 Tax=Malassezia vespertilionis TaxID=2020962 RepID=A0A2N1J7G9_9BASI|nr:uncharacterized protein MVES1_003344 [Malassezia vespertilionis]PKI82507.1 Rim101p [Malassezia vespertilionis]WFD07975.1 hypothetical protein MVES1_003344 [Malassezia vespertilionis]
MNSGFAHPEKEEQKELACQWRGCDLQFDSVENLYRHLCDEHVGRNSKNNLCLQCYWGDCEASYSKRDHITSHIRIHIPMKPYTCPTCRKSFKRSQDLKKHRRTHTTQDAPCLESSPEIKPISIAPLRMEHVPLYPNLVSAGEHREVPSHARSAIYRSPSYSGSASSSASSLYGTQRDTSPRGLAQDVHPFSARHMYEPLYPSLPKPPVSVAPHLPRFRQSPEPEAMRYEHFPQTGAKRAREDVDEFWDGVLHKRVAPVYDTDMAGRLTQMTAPGPFYEPGVLDAFLDASLHALHPEQHDRAWTLPKTPTQSIADVNAWLVQLGMGVTRSHGQVKMPHQYGTEASATPADFGETLQALGLDQIPGLDMDFADPTLSMPTLQPEQDGKHQYRHIQALTRAPLEQNAPCMQDEAMDVDMPHESEKPRGAFPRVPGDPQRHLNLILNLLLAINARKRVEPGTGRIVPLYRETRIPSTRPDVRRLSLYEPGAPRRGMLYRTQPTAPGAMRSEREEREEWKREEAKRESSAWHGVLPSISQLLCDTE